MIPRHRKAGPLVELGTRNEIPYSGRLRPGPAPVQRQLAVFTWIATSYRCWFRRSDHRRMLDWTFSRIIREEAHE